MAKNKNRRLKNKEKKSATQMDSDSNNRAADNSDTQLDEEETEEVVSKKRKTVDESDNEPSENQFKSAEKVGKGKNKKRVQDVDGTRAQHSDNGGNADVDKVGDGEESEPEYEVEAILDERKVKNKLQYLVHWKGYSKSHDTWEPAQTLNCDDVVSKYKASKKDKKKGKSAGNKEDEPGSDENSDKEYEVERILDVHFKRDGSKEFLVLWKGFSQKDSTWEPEEVMNCKDLIKKYMLKVEKAKNFEEKTLRVNRAPTKRFTLSTCEPGRRLGKRNSNKQRVSYNDCE